MSSRRLPLLFLLLQLFLPAVWLAALCFGWIYYPPFPRVTCTLHAALSLLILLLILRKKPAFTRAGRICSAWSVTAAALSAFVWLEQADALLVVPVFLICGAALWLCIMARPGVVSVVCNGIFAGLVSMVLIPAMLFYAFGITPAQPVLLENLPAPGGSMTAQVVRDSNWDAYLHVRFEPAGGIFGALEKTLKSYTDGDVPYVPELEWLDSDTLLVDGTEYDI